MTDLTPELENWLAKPEAQDAWKCVLYNATQLMRNAPSKMTARDSGEVYAHATILQQQAENAEQQATIERLEGLCQEAVMALGGCVATRVPPPIMRVINKMNRALQEAGE